MTSAYFGQPAPSTSTTQKVSIEYASLGFNIPEGMYLNPSKQDIMVWHGMMFVHQGYYAGAILRFRLQFPNEYPRHPPTVIFETDTFHPLISTKDGNMSLTGRFRPWIPDEHHVFDVLYYIKSAFKKDSLNRLNEQDALNHEAFRYKESTASFTALARQTTDLSQRDSVVYDNDESPSMRVSRNRHLPRPPQEGLHFALLDHVTLKRLQGQLSLTDWTKYED